ncbi:MAG TPA: fused MFS/spermidine synthase [Gemmatimonadales bacterium]|nr:fused MFS/spermidine synthase [Gemmatimonadales bacterium]
MDSPLAVRPTDRLETDSRLRLWGAGMGLAFTLAVFLSAALLFVVEPMFGKLVLPLLGGSPAVWITCMLFFQGALLLGYLYAHLAPRWLGVRRHAALHIVLLLVCVLLLPLGVAETHGAFRFEHPNLWLLWVLALSLGAPFVLLSSTGPLLQVWFSNTSHPEAHNPYFLYAASNAGSLLALLSYPFLIEPGIPLKGQATLWSLGYLVLVALVAVAAVYRTRRAPIGEAAAVVHPSWPRIGARTVLRWVMLAFVPSSFFLALTTYVTTDVAAVPLLWVVPLVLYLLSFTMVFARRPIIAHVVLVRWQPVGLIALAVIDFWGPSGSSPWLLPLHLIVFLVTALVCHGELVATKPPAARLTEFYLCIAVGGLLGGVFNALIAPALFDSVLEYSLTLLAACAVRPWLSSRSTPHRIGWDLGLIAFACVLLVATRVGIGDRPALVPAVIASAVVAMICLRMSRNPTRFALAISAVVIAGLVLGATRSGVLLKERNFFGVREVQEDARNQMRILMHGTTKHGGQSTDPARRREPPSYHNRQGPLGDVFHALPSSAGRRVAVIGLGTGAMAAYAGAGEEWVFYEIDPDIARVARDARYFTYLQDTPARVEVILGDGRLALAQARDRSYDLIFIDAFSSDAIPTHLLTLEALSVYRSKLSEKGVLVLHLSNRYLDLEPVLGRLVEATGVAGLIRVNTGRTRDLLEFGGDPSIWAAVASRASFLGSLRDDKRWRPLRVREGVGLWTDDFSNIVSVFRWP